MSKFGLIAVIAGLGLAMLSFYWKNVGDSRTAWSDEQAKAYTEAAGELHRLTYEAAVAQDRAAASGSSQMPMSQNRLSPEVGAAFDPAATPEREAERLTAKLTAAREQFAKQRAALDDARAHGQTMAIVMRWLGFSLAIAGVVALLVFDPNRHA